MKKRKVPILIIFVILLAAVLIGTAIFRMPEKAVIEIASVPEDGLVIRDMAALQGEDETELCTNTVGMNFYDNHDALLITTEKKNLQLTIKVYGITVQSLDNTSISQFAYTNKNAEGLYEYKIISSVRDYVLQIMEVFRILAAAAAVLIAVVLIIIFFSIYGKRNKEKSETKAVFITKVILMFICLCIAFMLPKGYRYLNEKFSGISIDQLIFHLKTNTGGTNWGGFRALFIGLAKRAAAAAVVTAMAAVFIRIVNRKTDLRTAGMIAAGVRSIILFGGFCMILSVLYGFSAEYKAEEYVLLQKNASSIYEEYYTDPHNVEITFPEKKKNLIYIFLESMETTYADEASGGLMEENYIPELTKLALENECFNGKADTISGSKVIGKAGWTVAAMVAQTSGVPLQIPANIDYDNELFLPGAYSIGEILQEQGYNNYLMFGSDKAFAGRDKYFTLHGNYEIFDYQSAIDEGRISEDYYVWWGFEDQKLFEYAKEKILELAGKDEPFNFTMLTVDTHFTDGYVCDLCEDEYPQQYSNVIRCASRQVSSFVEWIQEQDFSDDTVIVLSGDHLSMDAEYFSNITDRSRRKTYTAIINASKEAGTKARDYSTMDLYPTTLSALGADIEGDRLGLGTDLYSGTPTLCEEMSDSVLYQQLRQKSNYYDGHILYADE